MFEKVGDESVLVRGEEGDGEASPTGNPFTSQTLVEDMALKMNPMVSMVDKDDRSVITDETTSIVPPLTVDSNLIPDINMAEPFYRFLNRHKRGCYLNLPMASYNKLNLNKEITIFHPRSLSFMTVRLLRFDSELHNVTPFEQGWREMEFNTSFVRHVVQRPWCAKDENESCVVESLLASCVAQEYSTMEHVSWTNTRDNQPTGTLETPSTETAYMEEEVNSSWSNIDVVHLEESSVLKPLPVNVWKKLNALWVSGANLLGRQEDDHTWKTTCSLSAYH